MPYICMRGLYTVDTMKEWNNVFLHTSDQSIQNLAFVSKQYIRVDNYFDYYL